MIILHISAIKYKTQSNREEENKIDKFLTIAGDDRVQSNSDRLQGKVQVENTETARDKYVD